MNDDPYSSEDIILIIDDVPENVKLLLRFLTKAGFKVLIAKDGETGLQRAEYILPDLILLDVMMPGMDGFQVCRRLKSMEATQDIPIIFMTALTDTLDKVKGFEVGAADYITKPFHCEEVLARINTHLSICKLKQQLQAQNQQLKKEMSLRKNVENAMQYMTHDLAERTTKLQKYASELEQRNMELDAFAHTVAHDLKDPLNAVMGMSHLLVDDISTETSLSSTQFRDNLRFIEQAGQQIVNIIDALLLLAGVSRKMLVEFTPLDMSVTINQVIEYRLSHLITEHQAQIDLPDSWPNIESYGPWIEEIWLNYISNGLKYGGNPPNLELGANIQDDGMVCFWVRDNGNGLSKEEQAKLFTPFTRLHIKRVKGHGLGLSIVRQIAEKLGGYAGVESAPGSGSRFYFTLPKNGTASSNAINTQ